MVKTMRDGKYFRQGVTGHWMVLQSRGDRFIGITHVQDDFGNLVPIKVKVLTHD